MTEGGSAVFLTPRHSHYSTAASKPNNNTHPRQSRDHSVFRTRRTFAYLEIKIKAPGVFCVSSRKLRAWSGNLAVLKDESSNFFFFMLELKSCVSCLPCDAGLPDYRRRSLYRRTGDGTWQLHSDDLEAAHVAAVCCCLSRGVSSMENFNVGLRVGGKHKSCRRVIGLSWSRIYLEWIKIECYLISLNESRRKNENYHENHF